MTGLKINTTGDIRERLNRGLEETGGATVNLVDPRLFPKNCFVIGGAGETHTGDKDYFYDHVESWILASIYEGATHVGVWLDPETGIVHYDSLTVVVYKSGNMNEELQSLAASMRIGMGRGELAIGHFDDGGHYATIDLNKKEK